MANHDYNLANLVGSDARVDLNNLFLAIVSQNSSATEPATMFAYMFWFDTTLGYLKQRNAANTAWEGVSVAPATSGSMAARLDQVSLLPSVASATSPDIFGAAGVTINYTGTTTATSFVACTTAQVGSKKTIIPVSGASFTASANLIIDGRTSGTYLQPAGAIVDVVSLSTTQFKMTTIEAYGTWTPAQGAGITLVGTFISNGSYVKVGRGVTVQFYIAGSTSIAFNANAQIIANTPFVPASGENIGILMNDPRNTSFAFSLVPAGVIQSAGVMAATTGVSGTITFQV